MSNPQLMDDVVLKRVVLPVPAELRNMIYRDLVRKTYLVYWPLGKSTNPLGLDTDLSLPKALVEFPIFQVSKTTRREALALLYAESTLRYWVDRTRQSYDYRDACPSEEILELVQNIEICVSVPNRLSDVPSIVTVQTCKEIAHSLNQTFAPRHSLVIRFYDCDAPSLGASAFPLYRTLAKLTKFRAVTVEICGGAHRPYADRNLPLAKVRTIIQPGIVSHIIGECDRIKEDVRNAMEPMLGPVMEEDEVESAQNVCYARYLRFYPQRPAFSPTAAPAEKVPVADGGRGCDEEDGKLYEGSVESHPREHRTITIQDLWDMTSKTVFPFSDISKTWA